MSEEPERLAPVALPLAAAILIVLGVGVAALVGALPEDVALRPTPTPTATDTPDRIEVDLDVDVTDCDEPPTPFALLCEAHALLHGHYVDALEDDVLAAGAATGIDLAIAESDTPARTPAPEPVACAAPTEAFVSFCDAYAYGLLVHDLDAADLIEQAVAEMAAAIEDPNTAYVPEHVQALFEEDLTGEVEGIGALVETRNLDDPDEPCRRIVDPCALIVVAPIAGAPADEAGLRAGDRIIAFDGDDVEGETIHEAVSRGRGPAGTDVDVEVERDTERFTVTITRARVAVPHVQSEIVDGDIGYLHVIQFTVGTEVEFREHITDLLDAGATSFIVDLRNNPGGLTEPTREVASELLDAGEVFTLEFGGGAARVFTADPGGLLADPSIEVAVLINRGTVSAAEILAAALSEQGRATLIGEPSFGKATAQSSFPLTAGGAMRVTVARWLTPSGGTIDAVGVEPHVEVSEPSQPGDVPDTLLEEAIAHLRS